MNFEQQWLEYDYNPFILFSSNGKIKSVNSEAQFLLGAVNASEIFELASSYANITFGFKTTFLDLEFGRYKFFGLTVGYENEDEIGIKLYQKPSFKIDKPKPTGELTNIYTLVDLCISTNSISSTITYTRDYDPTIPEVMINSNEFIKLLNKIYVSFRENKVVCTKIYFRIGEHIKFEDKKYSLFSIEVKADSFTKINELKIFAKNSNFFVEVKSTTKNVTINIPMITS
ncbi:hypothetical protein JHD48_04045 [Sulfurimonas sp. SAG-AH-194-I05]|nr:hypothetical protein [Sulfurimonas sp. SAG-AH-194-I05]MDF1874899.1 hypothetical protein [Sulfurimonas sp. SAG-AH-194-I05]